MLSVLPSTEETQTPLQTLLFGLSLHCLKVNGYTKIDSCYKQEKNFLIYIF